MLLSVLHNGILHFAQNFRLCYKMCIFFSKLLFYRFETKLKITEPRQFVYEIKIAANTSVLNCLFFLMRQ